MIQYLIVSATLFFSSFAFAAEIFLVDTAYPLETQIAFSCPWIDTSEVQRIVIAEPEKIGWSGGDVGNMLGGLFEESGANINFTTISANIPALTRAVLMDTQYYNNNGQAQIIVDELSLITSSGDKITMALNDSTRTLSQSEGHSGEAILLCFMNDENFIQVSTKVTHKNVDGSRPTMGFTAFSATASTNTYPLD